MSTDLRTTYQEYRALPDDGPRYQLIEGELVEMSPSPTPRHQRVVFRLARALAACVEEQGLGEVAISPLDTVLSEVNVLQPDILYVSNSRKAIFKEDVIMGAPDLCIEVLLPSNADKEMDPQRRIYARYGVIELWLVDPIARRIELYRLQENAEQSARVFVEREKLTSALLPGLNLELTSVFCVVRECGSKKRFRYLYN